MPRLERVFVDTATLYPVSLADLVLRLAEFGIFELLWSDHLLAEVELILVDRKAGADAIAAASVRFPRHVAYREELARAQRESPLLPAPASRR